MTRPKPITNNGFVSEEGVLHASLLVVSRFLLPLATPDLPYSSDCAIPSARSPRSRRRSSSLLKIFDYVLLSPIDPVRLTGFLKHDCQPKSQGIEQCFEATELGVPILGKHPVQVLTV